MAKNFLTYKQQLHKLKNEKGLLINDEESAEEMLKNLSYYSLIGGYKDMFKNKTTKKYKDGTRFEDIVALYEFDRNLRELFLSYILRVENKIKSLLSYAFCEKYGEAQNEYLNIKNYNYVGRNKKDVDYLIGKVLLKCVNNETDYPYINHSHIIHKNIPLWVLKTALSFGNISVMYRVLTQDLQYKISREFDYVNEIQLAQVLKYLVRFRNVCAHGERLFSYKSLESIPDFFVHSELGIEKKGNQYKYGKQDLFAVVIVLKYIFSNELFMEFEDKLENIIYSYIHSDCGLEEKELLSSMGFPGNWTSINCVDK